MFGFTYESMNMCFEHDTHKDKNYHRKELNELDISYNVELSFFYSKELFDYLKKPELWDKMLLWLKQWKKQFTRITRNKF
jgi:hypothetical protein